MKKLLLQLAFLLLPFFALAQGDVDVSKDVTGKIKNIVGTFYLNDHEAVVQTNIDDKTFELIAINDKMEVVWRQTLKGYAISAGKFKGKVLAIACSEYKESSDKVFGPYTAFLLEEQTGKLVLSKDFYNPAADTKELLSPYFTDDSDCIVVIRQPTDGQHIRFVWRNSYFDAKDFRLLKLNDQLDASISKLKIPAEGISGFKFNKKGDLFTFAIDGKLVKVSKFEAGKTEASASIGAKETSGGSISHPNYVTSTSATDRNVFYFASMVRNADHDAELTVGKMDFNNKSSQTATDIFDSKRLKAIEKDHVPSDKNLEKPDVGVRMGMAVQHIQEYNGTIVATVANTETPGNQGYTVEQSIIINGYDLNLKQKFLQVMPSSNRYYPHDAPETYYFMDNSLYLTANNGKFKVDTYWGKLDLNTGDWVKLMQLPKPDLNKYSYSSYVLYFKNGFIIPYMTPRGAIMGKEVMDMQLYSY